MNTDIKRTLVDTFGRISYLFVIFFFFIYTLYLHNEVPEALKEALSASLSFLSVLATLGAAYIASKLFNDWKEQEEYNHKKESINKVIEISETLNKLLNSMNLPFAMFAVKNMSKTEFFNFLIRSYSKINEENSNILNNINYLASVKNKGFSSEKIFSDFLSESSKLTDKLEKTLLMMNELEHNSLELMEIKAIVENLKEFINSNLIKTLKLGLRRY
ncbi:MAG: hypothetical protein GAK29_04780 [Acinetobacter bereziniae]|uniref:Uncharacterized protein n=1 Tax=Acinetobacter bereziniae TaxID=106648 RepID=A0A833P8W9_ACIBZ|nr:MAG: hypothetical protein GAK29_04780 [Acinetobacter bereziniae]